MATQNRHFDDIIVAAGKALSDARKDMESALIDHARDLGRKRALNSLGLVDDLVDALRERAQADVDWSRGRAEVATAAWVTVQNEHDRLCKQARP